MGVFIYGSSQLPPLLARLESLRGLHVTRQMKTGPVGTSCITCLPSLGQEAPGQDGKNIDSGLSLPLKIPGMWDSGALMSGGSSLRVSCSPQWPLLEPSQPQLVHMPKSWEDADQSNPTSRRPHVTEPAISASWKPSSTTVTTPGGEPSQPFIGAPRGAEVPRLSSNQ